MVKINQRAGFYIQIDRQPLKKFALLTYVFARANLLPLVSSDYLLQRSFVLFILCGYMNIDQYDECSVLLRINCPK